MRGRALFTSCGRRESKMPRYEFPYRLHERHFTWKAHRSRFMSVIDVTGSYRLLSDRRETVTTALASELGSLADDHPLLVEAVRRLLDSDGSVHNVFRLLPFPVLGALFSDQDAALPVVVFSRLWWTGAEVFDDIADGDFDAGVVGVSAAQASIASVACLALMPQEMIARQDVPAALRSAWAAEFAAGSLSAAEGQLDDVSHDMDTNTWTAAMRIYTGKSGTPYGRDCAMTALLAGVDDSAVRGWRAFGRLFGVLRQMANDRVAGTPDTRDDLANGTLTLLLALAVEQADVAEAGSLDVLRARARTDLSARRELREHLDGHEVVKAYQGRVDAIHRKLTALLEALAAPSEHRDLIQWMVNESAAGARLTESAGAA
jgi:geranylgeranyl pyrophosphate synthase